MFETILALGYMAFNALTAVGVVEAGAQAYMFGVKKGRLHELEKASKSWFPRKRARTVMEKLKRN